MRGILVPCEKKHSLPWNCLPYGKVSSPSKAGFTQSQVIMSGGITKLKFLLTQCYFSLDTWIRAGLGSRQRFWGKGGTTRCNCSVQDKGFSLLPQDLKWNISTLLSTQTSSHLCEMERGMDIIIPILQRGKPLKLSNNNIYLPLKQKHKLILL